ncbi:MAG: ferritin family protein [Candidatus Aminicenantes bacterium]|nr:ferritin family protein [Candidatus Aminicenantes bacterium]
MKLPTFKDAINFAIKREEESIQGYGSMIDLAKTPGIKNLLQELQEEKRNDKQLLQDLTEGKIKSYEPGEVVDLKISDYIEEEPLDADMDFQGLLIFAAKKEQKAVELYSDLAKKSKAEEPRKLFEFLAEQEKSHKLKLEIEYDKYILAED